MTTPRSATGSGPTDRDGVRVLVVNAGSSSLKLRVIDDGDDLVAQADLAAVRGEFDAAAAAEALRRLPEVDAAGQESAAALAAVGATRTIGPARVAASDHPLRAAGDALRQAN